MHLALLLTLILTYMAPTNAEMTIKIDDGMRGAIPIAIVPFAWSTNPTAGVDDISTIVAADLDRSGRFRTLPQQDMFSQPHTAQEVYFRDWVALGQDALLVGSVQTNGDSHVISFQLIDIPQQEEIAAYRIPTTQAGIRASAHWIADIVYEKLTGTKGAFATKLAYITETVNSAGISQVSLKIADADGFNPQIITSSPEPIMSPAWSPDGKKIAYVSFENKQHTIYVQELGTGERQQVAAYSGINSAPAWAPDGTRLAVVLSKDGDPEIYVLNLDTKYLERITNNIAIDTEPSWSPDGNFIIFTSDRGGSPQIYQVSAHGGEPKRLTFSGDYNARPVYFPDGKSIALVTKRAENFGIGILKLGSQSTLQELTNGPMDESPTLLANGSMVAYTTRDGEREIVAIVSTDGRVRQRITENATSVREPAFSPYIK
ncbi:translocation protein TolB [Achromatium sp. WMS2]|nr:translocation protein TolB [Achromatium sp. WMS2]